MKLVSAAQMRLLDRQTIDEDGIPAKTLIERAGTRVAETLLQRFPDARHVACMVGKGNNGNDAKVAARVLEGRGVTCTLSPTFDSAAFSAADVIIDGLLGIGARSPLPAEMIDYINRVNALQKPVIAIDVPSGLDATTGASCGTVIVANCTVTTGCYKLGQYLGVGPDYVGDIILVNVGFSQARINAIECNTALLAEPDVRSLIPQRTETAHKGKFGHVIVIAGSPGKMGAGLLAARGALRAGAGLATYALPKEAFQKFDPNFAEVMIEELSPERIPELLSGKSAVVIGPGMDVSPDVTAILKSVLTLAKIPLVIDADALNCLANHRELLPLLSNRCVLTPHPGEMARLLHLTTAQIQTSRLELAQNFSKHHPVTLVLKGSRTIISAGTHSWINPTGNPGMATAGMGDVLAGVITGFLAQNLTPQNAACAGVYLHGLAGDIVRHTKGDQGMLATDVADALPEAIKIITS